MDKLEMIVDDGDTLWFYPDSHARVELLLKGNQEVYESPDVQIFLDRVDAQKYSYGDHIRRNFMPLANDQFPSEPVLVLTTLTTQKLSLEVLLSAPQRCPPRSSPPLRQLTPPWTRLSLLLGRGSCSWRRTRLPGSQPTWRKSANRKVCRHRYPPPFFETRIKSPNLPLHLRHSLCNFSTLLVPSFGQSGGLLLA